MKRVIEDERRDRSIFQVWHRRKYAKKRFFGHKQRKCVFGLFNPIVSVAYSSLLTFVHEQARRNILPPPPLLLQEQRQLLYPIQHSSFLRRSILTRTCAPMVHLVLHHKILLTYVRQVNHGVSPIRMIVQFIMIAMEVLI